MGFSRHETLHMAIDDRLRGVRLCFEPSPVRKVAVPFHERRDGAALADDEAEELPHRVADGRAMAVNDQNPALSIRLWGRPRRRNLPSLRTRKNAQVAARAKPRLG